MNLDNFTKKFSKALLLAGFAVISLSISAFGNPSKEYSDSLKLLVYKTNFGKNKRVKTLAEWKMKRLQILDGMQKAMGLLPDRTKLPALNINILDSIKEEGYTRYAINFTVEQNELLPAYLYVPLPKGIPKKLPAMLVLHETDPLGKKALSGISSSPNKAYAKELAQRGYVVIAPDYPGFGDMEDYNFETDRYQSGTMKAIFNHMRCIDLLQARKDVDPKRTGVLGHSLGGHNALFVAAFDTRIKVIVSSCGWTLFDYYNNGKQNTNTLGAWAQEVYMPFIRDKYNLDASKLPFDFDEIIAALAPRHFFSNSPLNDANFDVNGVKKGIANASSVYRFFNAAQNLQVRYPGSGHDFIPEVRLEAYQFIDKALKHSPNVVKLLY
ncbi:MAG: alpha/beta fold hydrolase [Segetibacter sp.]